MQTRLCDGTTFIMAETLGCLRSTMGWAILKQTTFTTTGSPGLKLKPELTPQLSGAYDKILLRRTGLQKNYFNARRAFMC